MRIKKTQKENAMYGKRRLVIGRDGRVSLQGSKSGKGGSSHPVGKLEKWTKQWSAVMVGDTLHPRGVFVGDYDSKKEAAKALLLEYKTSDHCLFPEEISNAGEFVG